MRIFLCQFQVKGKFSLNLKKVEDSFTNNLEVDLIVAPELFSTGFRYDDLENIVELNGKFLKKIQELCKSHKTAFAGSFIWRESAGYYNRLYFIDKDGNVTDYYDKTHLIAAFKEDKHLTPGSHSKIITFMDKKVGLAICYDLRFPELFREYAKDEADIILVVAQWPLIRKKHYMQLCIARAIENQCYVVAVNSNGLCRKTEMAGSSLVVDPWGNVLHNLNNSNQGLDISLEFETMNQYRKEFPALYDYSRN